MVCQQLLTEVYSSINGKVFQDSRNFCYVLEWKGERSVFKMPCFFSLKRRLYAIDLEAMLASPASCNDVEIIAPCGCDRCFVLTVPEILEMRSLLAGARVMMELNSLIYERLYRPVLGC